MKKIISLILCSILLFGCKKNGEPEDLCLDTTPETIEECVTEVQINSETCIIQYALVSGGFEKWVYRHDGTHYDQIQVFDKEAVTDNYKDVARWIIDFEYDQLGRVVREAYSYPDKPDQSLVTTFAYQIPRVNLRTVLTLQSGEEQVYEYSPFYYPEVPDDYYEINVEAGQGSYLREFFNGNHVRFAVSDDAGPCEIFDKNWTFTNKSYYDDRPNVMVDYAVRKTMSGNGVPAYASEFWYQENPNNMIGNIDFQTDENPLVYCWTFLVSPMGKYWVKSFQNIEYFYDCE